MDPYPKAYLYRRIVQAKLYIDARYAEPIDVDDISGEAAFSQFHFIRLFKSVYGLAPHAYLTRVRIDRAQDLLKKGLAVAEACHAVGFTSAASFSLLFKRATGITPSQYRARCLRRAEQQRIRPLSAVPNCFAQAKGWS